MTIKRAIWWEDTIKRKEAIRDTRRRRSGTPIGLFCTCYYCPRFNSIPPLRVNFDENHSYEPEDGEISGQTPISTPINFQYWKVQMQESWTHVSATCMSYHRRRIKQLKIYSKNHILQLIRSKGVFVQQVIHQPVSSGELRFSNEDDTPPTPGIQKETREKLLSIVQKDSATNVVHRLVPMSKEVYTCKRWTNEPFSTYAERFRRHAQTYFKDCYSSKAVQDMHNFALILLESAKLLSSTFDSIISLLVAGAKRNNWPEGHQL